MRKIRGLQITSLVVLSPVLLIMISLISMLVISIYSHVNSWLFQTAATTTAIIPHVLQQQQQQLLAIRNVSSDISIPYQRNLNTNKQFKRIRLFSRLRQSPMTWTILSIAYAVYILLKVLQIYLAFIFIEEGSFQRRFVYDNIQFLMNPFYLSLPLIRIPMHPLSMLLNEPKKIFFGFWILLFAGVGVGQESDVLCGGRSIQAADYY